jgi:hypothetical protein
VNDLSTTSKGVNSGAFGVSTAAILAFSVFIAAAGFLPLLLQAANSTNISTAIPNDFFFMFYMGFSFAYSIRFSAFPVFITFSIAIIVLFWMVSYADSNYAIIKYPQIALL